jgi:hypothetical protein
MPPAMNDNHFFADVELPFHVWVREDDRWVLREAPHREDDDRAHPAKATARPAQQKTVAARRRAA